MGLAELVAKEVMRGSMSQQDGSSRLEPVGCTAGRSWGAMWRCSHAPTHYGQRRQGLLPALSRSPDGSIRDPTIHALRGLHYGLLLYVGTRFGGVSLNSFSRDCGSRGKTDILDSGRDQRKKQFVLLRLWLEPHTVCPCNHTAHGSSCPRTCEPALALHALCSRHRTVAQPLFEE
jgi:hypothetical protein